MKKKQFLIIILSFFLFPFFTFATFTPDISFTEIMYDPAGTDNNYEWIEIRNNASQVNLKDWAFCEGKEGSSTKCRPFKEENNKYFILPRDAFAIITENREKFLEQNSFSGLILQTSNFSLLNSGKEKLEFKDNKNNIIDSIIYNPASGGKDGNTLCLIGDIWEDCTTATPGLKNNVVETPKEEPKPEETPEEKPKPEETPEEEPREQPKEKRGFFPTTYIRITDFVKGKKRVKAKIEPFPIMLVGVKGRFYGRAFGLTDTEIFTAEYSWTMGDGSKRKNEKEIFHTYHFPGEYIVSLTAKISKFTGNDKKKVKVIVPDIVISNIFYDKNAIEITNNTAYVLDLGRWSISTERQKFKIPRNTFIDSYNSIVFSNEVTRLKDFKQCDKFFLLSPDKKRISRYPRKEKIVEKKKEQKNTKNIKKLTTQKDKKKPSLNKKTNIQKNQENEILTNEKKENNNEILLINKKEEKKKDKILTTGIDKEKKGNSGILTNKKKEKTEEILKKDEEILTTGIDKEKKENSGILTNKKKEEKNLQNKNSTKKNKEKEKIFSSNEKVFKIKLKNIHPNIKLKIVDAKFSIKPEPENEPIIDIPITTINTTENKPKITIVKNNQSEILGNQEANILGAVKATSVNKGVYSIKQLFQKNIFYIIFLIILFFALIILFLNNIYTKKPTENITLEKKKKREKEKIKKESLEYKILEIK